MRAFLIFLLASGLFASVQAAEVATGGSRDAAATAAKAGRVIKVLPFFLDAQGRNATSPSLFDRDAYQAYLREHTNEISAVRYDVLWTAKKSGDDKFSLRLELRGVGAAGVPSLRTLETPVTPGTFRQWTKLTLGGDDYKNFGSVVAWRATLWRDGTLLGEQKSFLW
jgi:hypothetical protein